MDVKPLGGGQMLTRRQKDKGKDRQSSENFGNIIARVFDYSFIKDSTNITSVQLPVACFCGIKSNLYTNLGKSPLYTASHKFYSKICI